MAGRDDGSSEGKAAAPPPQALMRCHRAQSWVREDERGLPGPKQRPLRGRWVPGRRHFRLVVGRRRKSAGGKASAMAALWLKRPLRVPEPGAEENRAREPCVPSCPQGFPPARDIFTLSALILFALLHQLCILLPGKSHGRRSLVGCSPWGR